MKSIEFWVSIGSTYSYLSVSRIKKLSEQYKFHISWQPFSVRKLMMEMNNIPFTPPEKKSKSDYMWRDIERRSINYGLKAKLPAPYPLKEFDLANKLAVLALNDGWIEKYITKTYKLWFEEGVEAGSDQSINKCLTDIGLNVPEILNKAGSSEIREKYILQTDIARKKGIFGSPTFVIENEIFWGDDRLEDAIKWLYGTNI